MKHISESYCTNSNFFKLIEYISGENLPQIENHEPLELISNDISYTQDFVRIDKKILFPIQEKYRGFITSVLGLYKVELMYVIIYDKTTININVKSPKFLKKIVNFETNILITDKNDHTYVQKSIDYKTNALLSLFPSNLEEEFLQDLEKFSENMLSSCV